MNAKTLIPLVVAIALGVVAAKMGKDMMGKGGQNAGPGMKMSKHVVAKEDLAPGSTIKETDVTLKDMLADGASDQAFTNVGEVVGRVVTTQIVKNQAVMNTLLAPTGTAGGLPAMIPPGMRAVTLEVNEVSGLAGLLVPGAQVDLVQTIQGKGADQAMMARTIAENIRVLAVGRRTSTVAAAGPEGEPMAHSVTLLATAEQAEVIDLASHVGSPRLVLRNSADKKSSAGKGTSIADLRGDDREKTGPDGGPTDPIGAMIANMLANAATTRPTAADAPKAEVATIRPVKKTFREVEVIRGGASTSIRVAIAPDGGDDAVTGDKGSEKKLFGDD